MVHRARAMPRGPTDVLPARGRPWMWLGAEDSRAPGGHCWAAWASRVGDRRWMRGRGHFRPPQEPVSWTKAPLSPKPQGLRLWGPQCCPVSLPVLLVTSVCLDPCLNFLFSPRSTFSLSVSLSSFCLCLFFLTRSPSPALRCLSTGPPPGLSSCALLFPILSPLLAFI